MVSSIRSKFKGIAGVVVAQRLLAKVAPKLRITIKDLSPNDQVKTLSFAHGRFSSTGQDPSFRINKRVPAGWYFFEICLRASKSRAIAKIYVDTGSGESEDSAISLPLKSGRLTKRLFRLTEDAKLRFDPIEFECDFQLDHFRIISVDEKFAVSRAKKKLVSRHPKYASLAIDEEELTALQWRDYESIFKQGDSNLVAYEDWIELVEKPGLESMKQFSLENSSDFMSEKWPTFSVIMPVYNSDEVLLREAIDSVLAQWYPKWELCIVDDASVVGLGDILEEYSKNDTRVRVKYRTENGHISRASNDGVNMARGDFIALLDHDDRLAPHALLANALCIRQSPDVRILYSDEDKLDADGNRCEPFFKPDLSLDLLFSQNYVSHLCVYQKNLVRSIRGFRPGFEGSQDYDLMLRALDAIDFDGHKVHHIPQVLYHWRQSVGSTASGHDAKGYAGAAAQAALTSALGRFQSNIDVAIIGEGIYRTHWSLPSPPPKVSIIIPTRDRVDLLRLCITSLVSITNYPNYEILVVDNDSSDAETVDYLGEGAANGAFKVLRFPGAFNFSAINNFAVDHASGSVVCLLNNDVEIIQAEWLTELVTHACRPDVGCVGGKLLYPDGTLQHGGVVLGIGGVAGHSHKHFHGDAPGYFNRLKVVHDVSAVTAAALVVHKSVFKEVGGFDEVDLHVAFNDVDLCLKVVMAGYRNIWTPFSVLIHHESKTRGGNDTEDKEKQFRYESQIMQQRWSHFISGDPCYSPHLSVVREDYSIRI